jgi:hypothetical protein
VITLATKKWVAEMGAWFVAGFCTGNQEEYKLLMEHAGMAKSLKHLSDTVDTHFEFIILERTKGNQMSSNKCTIPWVGVTEETALCPRIWVKHLVVVLWEMSIEGGRLFTWRLLPAKLLEFPQR